MRPDYEQLYAKLTAEVERLLSEARENYAGTLETESSADYAHSELWVQLAHALFEISDCGGDELAQLITDIAADYDVALSPTNRLRIICDEPPGLLALPQPARSVRIPVIGTVVDDDELGNRVVFNGNGNGHDY